MSSWDDYYQKSKDRPLRLLYQQALPHLPSSANRILSVALDLGCGLGKEVHDLLNRGFEVHAIDREARAIDFVKAGAGSNQERLHAKVASFEEIKSLPKVDFFFANHSLPFCAPKDFNRMLEETIQSVKKDGLYVASFFGPEDDWAKTGKVVGLSAADLKAKLKDFTLLHFEETKKTSPTVLDGDKLLHSVDVIARRD